MRRPNRFAALLTTALLSLGLAACDQTVEETEAPEEQQETGEEAEPEGGLGEEGAEDEGALDS